MVSIVSRLALALLVMLPVPAVAAWRAVEGIDIATGKLSLLLIGDLDAQTSLYARCVDGHAEFFVDSYDGRDGELAPVGPVDLVISSDTGAVWRSEARYAREKSGYVTTTWLTRESISRVVADLAAAKADISISIEFTETGDLSTWDTDAKGSTAAGRKFLEGCPAPATATPPSRPAAPPAAPAPQAPPSAPAAPASNIPGGWQVQSTPDDPGYDYSMLATSKDGQSATVFACDNPQDRSITIIARAGGFPALGAADIQLLVGVGSYTYTQPGSFESATGLDAVSGYLSDDFVEALTDIASGTDSIRAGLTSISASFEYRAELPIEGAREAALQLAETCLTEAERASILGPIAPRPVGWELLDGEVAATLNSRAVLRAPTQPAAGRVEINCFAETGARQIAYYPDDRLEQERLTSAVRRELYVFVGEEFWDLGETRLSAVFGDRGIGSTDQAKIAEVLSALSSGPPEMTVSTRVNFGDGQPRKVPLGDPSTLADFLAACPEN